MDAREAASLLANWRRNVTPSPGIKDLVMSISGKGMKPDKAFEHGRAVRSIELVEAIGPLIDVIAEHFAK